MDAGEGSFEPVHVDGQALEVKVRELQEADFACSEPVPIGDQNKARSRLLVIAAMRRLSSSSVQAAGCV